jgi:antitoxin component of MazEF toxin-antitoxin module
VQINVGGITVEVQVGNEGSITEAIRAQAEEIAEAVAGIFAEAFTAQFANTPATGGAS